MLQVQAASAELETGEYESAGHAVHAPAPATEYCPDAQDVHAESVVLLYVPATQEIHGLLGYVALVHMVLQAWQHSEHVL
jgi:hypothetical protein